MLEPLAVDPKRSVAPAANSIASARLVFPAPAGPTSAITRVPLEVPPAMRLSLRPVRTLPESLQRARRAPVEYFTVRRIRSEGKGGRYGSGPGSGTLHRPVRFEPPWQRQSRDRAGAIRTDMRQNRRGAFHLRDGNKSSAAPGSRSGSTMFGW